MTAHEFDELLQRYLRDECTPQEKRLVEDWFSTMTSDNSDGLNDLTKTAMRNRLWDKVNMATDANDLPKENVRRLNYWKVAAIAASVTMLAVLAFVFIPDKNAVDGKETVSSSGKRIFVKAVNEKRTILLSDNSSVTLEPGSELQYPETFQSTREVQLTGEAFFEITRDEQHPFLVHADEIVTHVLGTSFRVKAYPDAKEIIVAVKTGKVSVSADGDQLNGKTKSFETVLTPNQQIIYKRTTRTLSKALVEKPEVVRMDSTLKMKYSNTPVNLVFESLSKAYGVEMQYDEDRLLSCTVTTDLTNEGLFERLEIICHAINARYTVRDTVIIIEGDGCD